MKVGMVLRYAAVAAVCCTMMVGCKNCKRKGSTTEATSNIDSTNLTNPTGTDMNSLGSKGGFGGPTDRSALQAQTVYFAYDSAARIQSRMVGQSKRRA